MTTSYVYNCSKVAGRDAIDWEKVAGVELVETNTGEKARLKTVAKAVWSDDALFFRFECEDDHVVATHTKRDDPVYDEDCVEIFIDEEGLGRNYMELEFSPKNVIFDALIENDGQKYKVNAEWNAEDMETEVLQQPDGGLIYQIVLPLHHFKSKPQPGVEWRINFYRIDESPEGKREFWAWSPTFHPSFHTSSRFGTIRFN